MANILITGTSGFIGYHTAASLLTAGHQLIAPVRPYSEQRVTALTTHKNYELKLIDLSRPSALDDVGFNHIDMVLHLAAVRGEGRAEKEQYRRLNVEATRRLLDLCLQRGVDYFLYVSTVGVFGTIPASVPAKVGHSLKPDNLYHQTKAEAEALVDQYAQKGLKTLVLRPTITYGEGDDGFIPKLVSLTKSKHLVLPTREVWIHLLHVDSFVRLIRQIAGSVMFDNGAYIVADREPISLTHCVNLIKQQMDANTTHSKLYRLPSFVYGTAAKLLNVMGWRQLETSVRLISQSWYFDITTTCENLNYQPDDTAMVLPQYLKQEIKK